MSACNLGMIRQLTNMSLVLAATPRILQLSANQSKQRMFLWANFTETDDRWNFSMKKTLSYSLMLQFLVLNVGFVYGDGLLGGIAQEPGMASQSTHATK